MITYADGTQKIQKAHCVIQGITLDPDFSNSRVFTTDFIPEGADVFDLNAPDVPLQWRNGRIGLQYDEEIVSEAAAAINSSVSSLREEQDFRPQDKRTSFTSVPVRYSDNQKPVSTTTNNSATVRFGVIAASLALLLLAAGLFFLLLRKGLL
jgi:hypothetical protein